MLLGEVDHPVGVEGGASSLDVETEGQSLTGGGIRHALVHLLGALDGDSVLLGEPGRAVALTLGWRGRIELEASPADVHIVRMLELSERSLEAALTDVAPRTSNI